MNVFATTLDSPLIPDSSIIVDPEPDALHACKILVVDDEPANVRLVERILTGAGFDNFISTTDSSEAATLFADFEPDLVLTDWLMPGLDGCAVIQQIRGLTATDDYLPIVVLTADITSQAKMRALAAGATDFLIKPFDQIEILLRIENLLTARLSHLTVARQKATLEENVRQRTMELERALVDLTASQKQIIQQERLAALGTMAGGIAHDFNNALCIIMGFGELLLRDLPQGLTKEKATEPLTTMLGAADDAAKIVRRLREFYRPAEAEREDQRIPLDLNKLVTQAVSLTKPRWDIDATACGRPVTVTAELGDIPLVDGDAVELREVCTNLIFNAVDALPKGGVITIRTRLDGDSIVLTISDTGIGMAEDVRRRCFEPFFTTKGKSGTGLGLAMVFGIIQRHAGTIDIESEPGFGTNFVVRLPATQAELAVVADPAPVLTASLRILVVDDQPTICRLLCQQLQDDFHTVETAQSGKEALEKFRIGKFDLVLTDHVMAEMTGEQLAVAIKRRDPKIPVILLTGYAGESAQAKDLSPAVDLVLEKPLTGAALRRAFAKVMNMAKGV